MPVSCEGLWYYLALKDSNRHWGDSFQARSSYLPKLADDALHIRKV